MPGPALLDAPVTLVHDLVAALTGAVAPVAGEHAAALAIVLFVAALRLLLLPLGFAQARGEAARRRLMPETERLRRRHRADQDRLRRELAALYAKENATPFAGCLPALVQAPVFMVVYRLFIAPVIGGHPNALLAHQFLGVPLGQHVTTVVAAGSAGPILVFAALFALLAAVAWWSSRQARAHAAVPAPAPEGSPQAYAARLAPLLPYGMLLVAAVVPLAAAFYLLLNTAWTTAERAVLRSRLAAAA
ncbi:membrane protein insertase YidC [Bailinhaonella thermotolerans]|uniref:Membrane protein insertase YidC n=1 Tax=Bailinhaonella thermotolerans TaxID=1070861 RepID=A0A3A4BA34_9ACTN|nr:membrane protein insertase YidC [Bailinhaonella thermotolerans]RJL34594.1 membrane protein insertase YidC [Bailinhaonella thermotolerans]